MCEAIVMEGKGASYEKGEAASRCQVCMTSLGRYFCETQRPKVKAWGKLAHSVY